MFILCSVFVCLSMAMVVLCWVSVSVVASLLTFVFMTAMVWFVRVLVVVTLPTSVADVPVLPAMSSCS